ncbi:hypothetical protein [Novosphingobium resinovorum]|uniref:hypothetical protein n=1 Tax=Novosphingobium resinovorum TaxID=158500 RepID=UPI002ED19879|nr:hypothetical protein [Novosphingobium resinovorum]
MSSLTFYREQAEMQEVAANATSLPQVRDRCLRAASAWTELADRAQKTEEARKVKAEGTAADEASAREYEHATSRADLPTAIRSDLPPERSLILM